MTVPRLFKRKLFRWRTLHKAVTICILASLLAGLIPPPLVRSVLPAPAADLAAAALLPTIPAAQAAVDAAPVANPVAMPVTAPVEAPAAAPLAQGVSGSNVLTVTKTISGTGSGPFNLTITGPSGYVTNTTIDGGQTKVLTGLASGIYTVTESTPAGWTTVYTATPGMGGNSRAVVNLSNAGNVTPVTPAAIAGKVYQDYNSNGQLDTDPDAAIDASINGVTVTAYDPNGNACGNTTSDTNGNYSLTPTCNGPWRLVFSTLPAGYEPSTHGVGNGTSVQFISAGASNVNFAVQRSEDYCQNNPQLCTVLSRYGINSGVNGNAVVAATFPYNAGSNAAGPYGGGFTAYDTPAPGLNRTFSQLGSLYGIAYSKQRKSLYLGALMKRHMSFGPGGPGAIYQVDPATGNVTTFATLNAGTDPHPATANEVSGLCTPVDGVGAAYNPSFGPDGATNCFFNDPYSFAAVGKRGLGDIDLNGDEDELYVINLFDRNLYRLNATTGAVLGNVAPPTPASCTATLRPFGLGQRGDVMFVGMVCDDATNAYVYSYSPAAGYSAAPVLQFALNYARDLSATFFGCVGPATWRQWSDVLPADLLCSPNDYNLAHAQPILSDIEFDNNGNMLIGLRDRLGDQTSSGSGGIDPTGADTGSKIVFAFAGGDLLKACANGATWVIEGTSGCPQNAGQESGVSEWYNGDTHGVASPQQHQEISMGGLAHIPGYTTTVLSAYDPIRDYQENTNLDTVFDQGVRWFNDTTGGFRRGYRLVDLNLDQVLNSPEGGFGKANGIGDVEALCDLAPIEIGNRVWDDLNGNGIQDPGEPGINGLTVSLQGPTNTVTVVTSDDGNYYFDVSRTTAYTLTITPPGGYSVTKPNAAALTGASVSSNHAISDTIDSDALLVSGAATIYYTTGSAGQNNHGLDFGFTQPASGQVDILNIAPAVVANPGGFTISKAIATTDGSSPSVSGTFAVVVSCPGVSGYPATLNLNANGTPVTAGNLAAGTVCTFSENTLTLPNAPAGYTWVNASISPASITIASNLTATVTAHNTLAPLPTPPTNVLTVTKTISGTGSGPFNLTITGPSGYVTNTTIDGGQTKVLTGLASGLYTVTESTPAGWTTVYTATPGTVSSVNGVVTLANENTATLASTPISGKVFRDFNSDGQITANGTITDTGVSGVTVTAYDKNSNAVGSATSAADGTYTINPTGAGPYRIEFSSLPAGYEPTTHGTGNGTSVQFIDTAAQASGVNFGLLQPCDYCQNNPRLATTLLSNGDPLMVGSPNATWDALVSMGYGQVSGSVAQLATAAQVGSVWGVAYNNQTQRLYASAMIRRHMGLGANGIGAIYSKSIVGGTPTLFYDFGAVAGTIPTNATRQITTTSASGPTRDTQAFPLVAKAGLGDIDISQDGTRLYAMNLADQKLYYVSTNSPAAGSATAAGTMPWLASNPCTNGTPRPWGIGIDNRGFGERVYAGIVCDASGAGGTAANLTALVYEYNPASNGWTGSPVLSVPLNYTRQTVNGLTATGATVTPETNSNNGWRPWTDSITTMLVDTNTPASDKYYYQQPVLSDIEFDDNGDMILGFFSRTSVQLGWANWLPDAPYGPGGSNTVLGYVSGEILRAGLNSNNALTTWTIEDDGVTTGVNGTRTSTATGSRAVSNPDTSNPTVTSVTGPEPSGLSGANGQEFYWGDLALGVCCGNYVSVHGEASQGALALLPGSGQVVMTEMDAQPASASGTWTLYTRGLHYLSNSTGGRLAGYNMGGDDATFSKAGSMGDLELLCNPAPIEIGNRVWNDLDGDGVQDAGEPALAGVQVQLKQGGAVVAQTTSDANGAYYFNQWESLNTSAQTLTSPINDTRNDARQNATGVANNSDLFFSDRYLGLNFPNLNIPVGATITSATIRFTAADTGTISNVTIKGYANPDAAVWTVGTLPFTGSLSDLYVNNSSSASVTWSNGATWVAEESGINQTTPDLSTIVQEIVNLPTWQRNKTVAFLFQAPTNASGATAYGYSSNAGKGAVLSISFMGTTDGRLQANTAYTIEVPMSQAPIQNNGYNLTTPNAAALTGASVSSNHAISDVIDSDAVLVGGEATIYYTTGSAGQNNHGLDFGFTQPVSGQVDILNIAPAVVANPGGFSISKAIATTDGSSPSVSGSFAVVVSCPGVSGYPATLNLNANGTPVTAGNLAAGTVCTFSENTLTLPNAPTGYTWVNATISPASITIASNLTATVTATNWLAPLPTPPTNVLTVTKTIIGTGSGPFNLTITGPSGYLTTTTIDGGQTKTLTGLANGIYTVTESTPAGWTTVYTATTSAGSVTGSTNGVVALQNSNTATLAITPITGTVFRDYNSNGVMNATGVAPNLAIDSGVSGVTVTAYDRNSNAVGSATSAANGTYTLNPTAAGPYRIAFTTLPVGYEPTTHGAGNGTSTQFVTTVAGASNVNLGINHPADYTQTAPKVLNVMFQNGDPLVTGSTVASSQSIVQWNYSNTGTTPAVTALTTSGTTGTLWGTALQRSSKTLLTSAVIRRHAGLGPNGVGAIYRTALATNATSLLVDVNTLAGVNVGTIASNAARGLLDLADPNIDSQAFDAVGKVGIGQIELSGDEKTLFFTNLADRSVYGMVVGIPAATPTSATQYAIPATACTKGEARPWALKQYRNTLYVGVVCSGENAAASPTQADLSAHVYAMDLTATSPAFAATPVITFPLDYNKGCAVSAEYFTAGNSAIPNPPAAALDIVCRWNPWTATMSPFASFELSSIEFAYPQPILSDIDFDADGAMLLSFSDRAAMQLGSLNYLPTDIPGTDQANKLVDNGGDLLRAYRTGAATWILESGGDKDGPGPFTPTVNNTQLRNTKAGGGAGPGGQGPGGGEFYYADSYLDDHEETVIGSVLVYPGSGEAMVTFMDPFGYDSSGVAKFSSATGGRLSAYRTRNGTIAHFGKSASMGELELLVDPAPIEIGNRVWDDLDGDGVQDPGEPGLNGVQVTLQAPTGTVGTVNTSGDGNYYFGNLQANTHYTLTITSAPAGYSVTTPNAAALSGASVSSNHAISDTIDSDAVLVGGVATIYYTTGSAGQNNHGLDFGFTQPVSGQVDILNIAPAVVANPGGFTISKAIATTDGSSPSVSGTFAVVVSCPGVSGYPATLNLNANGTPVTAGNLVSGTVCSFSENTLTLPNAPTGYTWVNATISPASITIQSNVTATVTARNTLAPLPVAPTNVLTVTKTISGTGSGPFDITIAGPSGYMTNTQIDDGDVLTFNVPSSGLYTVTESTPAGWTTVYTATPGSVSSISGVVTVANENTATLSSTPISGKVFRDYNSDGQITANGTVTDTGVSGVTVTAYDKNGNAVGSATSASDGAYTINPTGDGPYRIEFTNLPSSYKPTTHGTQNGTSTQFVTTAGGATNVNLGILDPCDYCAELPRIVAQTYVNRDIATAFTRTLVSMPYTVGGVSNGQGRTLPGGFAPYYDPSKVTTVVDAVEMGATFGLAYQRNSRTLFAAAFMKASNGTPATSNGFGPGGPGAIYQIAPGVDGVAGTADDVPTVWLDINSASYTALLGANAAGTDPHVGGTSAQADAEYAAVGKIGFGGMAIGPDDETLYTINLNQRALYILPIGANQAAPAAALITTQDIPYPADCTSGTVGNPDVRPFALTIHRNRGYVGLVCTAESTQDKDALRAYVYPFDLSTGVFGSSVLNEPLTYTRTSLVDPVEYRNRWFAWTVNNTQLVNQPWLTDLQFDGDDLILAFRNRLYDQRGDTPFTNGGDVLRACAVGGVLTLESNGSCGGVAGAGANGQFFAQGAANSPWSLPYGPGGGYYYLPRNSDGSDGELNDSVSNGNRSRLSPALGGLALLPGASDTIITQVDPSEFHNAGLMWVRNRVVEPPANRAGYSIRGFQVLPGNSGPVPGEALFGGKGSGMGDMVLLCDPAPIEIGNRVWDDLDGDGVQDPGEPGLNGVQVTLQSPTGTVGTVNTSGDGNYYFGNLQANTHYTLTITSAPAGYSVTTPNAVALIGASVSSNHAISDTIDSDAVLVGGVATIYYTTGSAGQNNHGLDFGFTQPARGQVDILNIAPAAALVSLGNRVWYDTNNNGTVDSGEQNVGNGVAVELYQDSDSSGGYSAGDSRVASRVTSGGYYTFTGLTPSSSDATRYLVVITATNFLPGGLLSGYHSSTGAVTDNTLAADNDKDHGTLSGVLGQTGGVVASSAISLTAGTQPTGEGNEGNDPIQSSTDANSNQTIDFGFYSLSVGNRVWIDNGGGNSANADNGQLDSGESGLNGVTVELLDSANAVVSTTTTSNGGYYTFTGLISGTYSVRISGYPATYRSSTDTVNASAPTNADDDDNGSGTGTGALTSQPFVLIPGSSANGHSANNATGITSNPRIDFGLYEAPASFALDKRLVSPVSGIANIGDAVVYDLVITNTGAITLTSVTLVDSYDADYLQYNSASINPTAQATGVLTWTLTSPTAPLPLSAGETMTVTVTFTAVKP